VVTSGNVRGKLPGGGMPGSRSNRYTVCEPCAVTTTVRSFVPLAFSAWLNLASLFTATRPLCIGLLQSTLYTRTIPRYSWRIRAVTQAGATLRRTCWHTFGARRRAAAGGTVCYSSPERLRPVQRTHNLVQPIQVVNAPLPCNRISAE